MGLLWLNFHCLHANVSLSKTHVWIVPGNLKWLNTPGWKQTNVVRWLVWSVRLAFLAFLAFLTEWKASLWQCSTTSPWIRLHSLCILKNWSDWMFHSQFKKSNVNKCSHGLIFVNLIASYMQLETSRNGNHSTNVIRVWTWHDCCFPSILILYRSIDISIDGEQSKKGTWSGF